MFLKSAALSFASWGAAVVGVDVVGGGAEVGADDVEVDGAAEGVDDPSPHATKSNAESASALPHTSP
jgi:hypothetical protein